MRNGASVKSKPEAAEETEIGEEPPRQCHGYPSVFLRNEPKEEINFFLPIPIIDGDGDNDNDNDSGNAGGWRASESGEGGKGQQKEEKKESKYLACSWITAASTHSTNTTNKEAESAPTSTPTNEKKKGRFFSKRKNTKVEGKYSSQSPSSPPASSPETVTRTTILNSIHKDLVKIDTSKEVIIICHGLFSWRNQMLIANMASLLSSKSSHEESSLASSEPALAPVSDYHTLRFDFTGNGHSSGKFSFASYQSDFEDLSNVYNFVTDVMNFDVCCIIGHSQGSAAILKHAASSAAAVPTKNKKKSKTKLYVNLSGRCTRPNGFRPQQAFTPDQCRELELNGKFEFQTWSGSRMFEVTAQSVNDRIAFDLVKEAGFELDIDRSGSDHNNDKVQVLTIHGDKDSTVPIENAFMLDKLIPNHTIKTIPGANHNFNGMLHINTIVSSILDFIRMNRCIT